MTRAQPRIIVATAPTRIDFGGGWTDVPPYASEAGGFVCNLAIERRATARLQAPDPSAPRRSAGPDPLAAAALRRAGLQLEAALESDFPVGAGLGGSSAMGVALQGAIAAWTGDAAGADRLVQRSREVEVEELGVAGGWQDHCAAAYGGALGIRFEGDAVLPESIPLAHATVAALARRLVVVHSGESRISGATITAVRDAWRRGDGRVVRTLDAMKTLARQMADALRRGDVDALGALVGEHWTHQRELHPGIPTPRIDAIIAEGLARGALGAKALGASGGGCVVLIAPDDGAARVREGVAPLGELLEVRPAMQGLIVREEGR
ncbi:MAG: GHMP family kinase ATP-binding protein [Gemmatimonadaceae bacterium]